MERTYRKWILARPMTGASLGLEQFELQEHAIPGLKEGEALVRVKLINVHSNTRMRIARGMTGIGETDPTNYACGEIVQSRDPAFREGDVVACQAGWQDYQVIRSSDGPLGGYGQPSELVKALNGTNSQWCYVFRAALVRMWSSDVLMEIFGTSGMTAYFGTREVGPLLPRDTVAVAGASGSVGSIVAQLAKIAGCRVVGFAGGEEQCARVVSSLGIDGCLDYRAADLDMRLADAFPEGIDVYSDGVGGTLTKAVVKSMNRNGRMFSFGSAAAFYATEVAPAPAQRPPIRQTFGISGEIERVLAARNVKSVAWIVDEFYHARIQAEDELSRLLRSGKLKPATNVVDGFDSLPAALTGLYANARSGKLQVRFDAV